jgi:peptidoglycan/xylan/chitin deacetylase (PgdA/CDA1 family)
MKRVTLSFDNGPDQTATPLVLDTLARYDLKSAFFVIGTRLADPKSAALAERASREGHWIGNHTFTHSVPLGKLSPAAALAEIDHTEQALARLDLQPQPMRLFRPYAGAGLIGPHLFQPAVIDKLCEDRFTCVVWNSVPGDWLDPEGWVARALNQCRRMPSTSTKSTSPASGSNGDGDPTWEDSWSLVVLHDIASGAMAKLDEFIRRLHGEGYQIMQEFPPECCPIVNGRVVQPMEALTAVR